MENVAVLLLAMGLDVVFGDPPNSSHPVAWLGKIIEFVMNKSPRIGIRRQVVFGIIVVIVITIASFAAAWFLFWFLRNLSLISYVIAGAVVLKLTIALRGLRLSAINVRNLVAAGELESARNGVKALVGRDTSNLNGATIVSAVVESVAENSTDSLVAPLFYFTIFGIPGAVAYRVINTFDAMIGHHGRWEYLGKCAARLDDAANYIPARLSALLLVIVTRTLGGNSAGAWRVMLRDRRLTESPNAGWTMSATAGALGVQLVKEGFYRLNEGASVPSIKAIDASLNLLTGQVVIWVSICLVAEVIRATFA